MFPLLPIYLYSGNLALTALGVVLTGVLVFEISLYARTYVKLRKYKIDEAIVIVILIGYAVFYSIYQTYVMQTHRILDESVFFVAIVVGISSLIYFLLKMYHRP